jgi:hypothetical protein
VVFGRVRQHDEQIDRGDVAGMTQIDVGDVRAGVPQTIQRFFEARPHLVVQQIAEVAARHRQPHSP